MLANVWSFVTFMYQDIQIQSFPQYSMTSKEWGKNIFYLCALFSHHLTDIIFFLKIQNILINKYMMIWMFDDGSLQVFTFRTTKLDAIYGIFSLKLIFKFQQQNGFLFLLLTSSKNDEFYKVSKDRISRIFIMILKQWRQLFYFACLRIFCNLI